MPTLKFNVKNVKYAVPDNTGDYSAAVPASIGKAANISLEPAFNEQEIYADGEIMFLIASDKGLNGSLGLVTIEDQYEIDMGRKMTITDGTADVEQRSTQKHALYFESNGVDTNGNKIVIKTWLFNVTTSKPTESYEQDSENINPQNYSMNLNVLGTNLEANLTTDDYVDSDGNTVKVWKMVSTPTDSNYATFGDSVPTPKAAA